jgi:hypothetical protein
MRYTAVGVGRPGPARYRHFKSAPRNWRSFTGIERKTNARTRWPPASAQLAFLYRDTAENERQNGGRVAGAGERPGMPDLRAGPEPCEPRGNRR